MKYTKAPISEVVFGITFRQPIPDQSEIHKFYVSELSDTYPISELANPLVHVTVSPEGELQPQLNQSLTGPASYNYRTSDRKYLIQVQQNKLYFNWIRNDHAPTGEYPGYSTLREKFQKIVDTFITYHKFDESNMQYCSLLYQDRFKPEENFGEHPFSLFKSTFPTCGDTLLNFSHTTNEIIREINSLTFRTIETIFTDNAKLIRFSNVIQSLDTLNMSYNKWFDSAHKFQIASFENTFSSEVLSTWM